MSLRDKKVNTAINRLETINWTELNSDRVKSNVSLFKEFLRRSAIWAQFLDNLDNWPIFDIAGALRPEAHNLPDVKRLKTQPGTYFEIDICQWYLKWMWISEDLSKAELELPDPYEPLIRLFERRGSLSREHNFVDVDNTGIFLRQDMWNQYISRKALDDLSDEKLNTIDSV